MRYLRIVDARQQFDERDGAVLLELDDLESRRVEVGEGKKRIKTDVEGQRAARRCTI